MVRQFIDFYKININILKLIISISCSGAFIIANAQILEAFVTAGKFDGIILLDNAYLNNFG